MLAGFFIISCKDNKEPEPRPEKNPISENIEWIETTMRDKYYWYKDIPSENKLDYTLKEEDFFKSLLSDNDGKTYYDINNNKRHYYFSTIEKTSGAATYSVNTRRGSTVEENISYGFNFMSIYNDQTYTTIQLLVRYIHNDSPAKESGLKRGDWIVEINGKPITPDDAVSLSNGGEELSLTVSRWNPYYGRHVVVPEKISLPAARHVEDNPVHMAKVITTKSKGKKVGYLIYNHFTNGIHDNDSSYDNELRTLSATTFDGVDEFVLDLRYNGGGYISSALLLCAVLAPGSALEKTFGYLEYNDNASTREVAYKAGQGQLMPNGKNLNLSTLYVLVSSESASASEMIINSLRPYMDDVVVIGEQTMGKNVASMTYTSKDKAWEINPIVARISNSERKSDYVDGFSPDYLLYEAYAPTEKNPNIVSLVEVCELGDENERLLSVALNLIDGKDAQTRSARSVEGPTYTPAPIVSRNANQGAIIETEK